MKAISVAWHGTWLAYERWQLRRWIGRVERRNDDLAKYATDPCDCGRHDGRCEK
jgi:hypothetical protein